MDADETWERERDGVFNVVAVTDIENREASIQYAFLAGYCARDQQPDPAREEMEGRRLESIRTYISAVFARYDGLVMGMTTEALLASHGMLLLKEVDRLRAALALAPEQEPEQEPERATVAEGAPDA